jgi:hypothetical protein
MAEIPGKFTFSLHQSHLRSIRLALNQRLVVLAIKSSNTTNPERIARYQSGCLDLATLRTSINDLLRQGEPISQLTLTGRQCGIAAHAVMHTRRDKKAAKSDLGNFQETTSLDGLTAIEEIFKDTLPTSLLRHIGYSEDELQSQAET